MDLRVLRYFLTVAREESIIKAAEVLHVTQPTLSRQLKELEEEFGTPLFIRGNRSQGIVLTEKGIILRRRAEEMLTLADRTTEEMLQAEDEISGRVSIGGGESAAMRIIAKTANEIQKHHPNIQIDLFSGNADDVKEKLDQGILDFGVFIEPTSLDRYHTLRLPATDRWGVLVNVNSLLSKKEFITSSDLIDEPLLISRQNADAGNYTNLFGISFRDLNIIGTYNLLYNASLMVSEGYGSALCIDNIINTAGTNLKFIPFSQSTEVNLNLAWKKYQSLNKVCNYFLEKYKETLLMSLNITKQNSPNSESTRDVRWGSFTILNYLFMNFCSH